MTYGEGEIVLLTFFELGEAWGEGDFVGLRVIRIEVDCYLNEVYTWVVLVGFYYCLYCFAITRGGVAWGDEVNDFEIVAGLGIVACFYVFLESDIEMELGITMWED